MNGGPTQPAKLSRNERNVFLVNILAILWMMGKVGASMSMYVLETRCCSSAKTSFPGEPVSTRYNFVYFLIYVIASATSTSGENIGDQGLIQAYRAWKAQYDESFREGNEYLLPGLNFTR